MLYQVIGMGALLATEDAEPSSGTGLLLIVVVLGAAYFLFLGPKQRKMKAMRKEISETRSSIEYGDEIVTVGGIYGRVTAIAEDDVTIDVGGGTELRIKRRAIGERVGADPE